MAQVPKAIYKFKTTPIKILTTFFVVVAEMEKLILKFVRIARGPDSQNHIEREEQSLKTQILIWSYSDQKSVTPA